jgi:predicted nuclease with TOPRIM domain
MDLKDAYQHKIQAELNEWQSEIDQLKAKASRVGAEQKLRYYQELESLRVKHLHLRQKLEELRISSDNAWKEVKTGVDAAWQDLRNALDSAKDKLR